MNSHLASYQLSRINFVRTQDLRWRFWLVSRVRGFKKTCSQVVANYWRAIVLFGETCRTSARITEIEALPNERKNEVRKNFIPNGFLWLQLKNMTDKLKTGAMLLPSTSTDEGRPHDHVARAVGGCGSGLPAVCRSGCWAEPCQRWSSARRVLRVGAPADPRRVYSRTAASCENSFRRDFGKT